MIKSSYDLAYEANRILNKRLYQMTNYDLASDISHRIERKSYKLNRRRCFLQPEFTFKEAKSEIMQSER